jgi:phage replication-related protein YjqB (UPF0714/DUF867 family)
MRRIDNSLTNVNLRSMNRYRNFAELARHQSEDRDYRITVERRPASRVAVIAPHAGSIERRTTHISRAIAGDDFNLYLFEGLDSNGSYAPLHVTSHRFDEPACLSLIARCLTVLAVHGCHHREECAYVGGLDNALKQDVAEAIRYAGVPAYTGGHDYPGRHPRNVCNRGASGRGVQLELSDSVRGGVREAGVIETVRNVLLDCQRVAY